jgi:hypothetical protein
MFILGDQVFSVIPAKAGIQVKPNLNQLSELFEKLLHESEKYSVF